jgi:hypothetical protein
VFLAEIGETVDVSVMGTQLAATRIVAMIEELSSVRSAGKAMGLSGEDLCEADATMTVAVTAAHKPTLTSG